jgi:hypothetical protein
MTTTSEQLGPLIKELHAINEEMVDTARPLERLAELDEKARDLLGKELRARLERWESITQKIRQVLDRPLEFDSAATN